MYIYTAYLITFPFNNTLISYHRSHRWLSSNKKRRVAPSVSTSMAAW